MPLNTLKGIDSINNHKIHRVTWEQPKDHHIEINEQANAITFKIQEGPIKENGHNGCQVDEIIATALLMIKGLNERFSCRQNSIAITKLEEALMWLEDRKKDRAKRGVEGQSKP